MSIEMPDWFWEFPEVERQQRSEDTIDDIAGEFSVGKHIEMANQTIGDKGPTSSRRTHCAKDNQIFQFHEEQSLSIIPSFVV